MKRRWIILALIALVLIWIYAGIPSTINVHQSITIGAPKEPVYRQLSNTADWKKWWPKSTTNDSSSSDKAAAFLLHHQAYTLINQLTGSLIISVADQDQTIQTSLDFIPTGSDSIVLDWNARVATSYQPIKRMQAYFKAAQLQQDFKLLLGNIQTHFTSFENVYGISIAQIPVVDSLLIFTSATSTSYPSSSLIYNLIHQLADFSAMQGAEQTGPPMLNVQTDDSLNFVTKVAIPVNKRLSNEGNIQFKGMLAGGKILVSDVKGGPAAIAHAMAQMDCYFRDYQKNAPAIPFMSLTTDRIKEPDSAKWITRLYYPVM